MKILFAALHHGYFRNLESVVEELASRGHQVHLAAERADRRLAEGPSFTVSPRDFPTSRWGWCPDASRTMPHFWRGRFVWGWRTCGI